MVFNIRKLIVITVFMFVSFVGRAEEPATDHKNFEVCMTKVIKEKPGNVIKVELKEEGDKLIYEFDIRDEKNNDWDIECDRDSAEIIEIEEEVFNPLDQRFTKMKKIDLDAAKATALRAYPGEIIEVEYEIENDGLAVYELDIDTTRGEEIKLEVNATTGEIHEVNRELWQIGYE